MFRTEGAHADILKMSAKVPEARQIWLSGILIPDKGFCCQGLQSLTKGFIFKDFNS